MTGGFRGLPQAGVSSVELLIALPVLLLMLLGIIQFVLIFHARHSLEYALTEAARRGAVEHAAPAAIQRGLAVGMAPWLYGASDWHSKMLGEARALLHVKEGLSMGWLQMVQRSPTLESFQDWAEPARDHMGERIANTDEIPNDNLDNRRLRMLPKSGVAGRVGGEPVGQRSGQTLADANLLRLEMDYGVRVSVPIVGTALLKTLIAWHGCGNIGVGYQPGTPDICRYYKATDLLGRPAGRIPVKVVATVRMMSPARRSAWLQTATTPPPSGGASGALRPLPTSQSGAVEPARTPPVPAGDAVDGAGQNGQVSTAEQQADEPVVLDEAAIARLEAELGVEATEESEDEGAEEEGDGEGANESEATVGPRQGG
ncbi:MAG: TadE/TadG family type IV pilus assembly protein [Lautropia sp.]|nr:TadE/TadG family type IV pilus assembly protein [Lautropia sp.]